MLLSVFSPDYDAGNLGSVVTRIEWPRLFVFTPSAYLLPDLFCQFVAMGVDRQPSTLLKIFRIGFIVPGNLCSCHKATADFLLWPFA
jgi:hypothetical protein